MAKVDLNYGCSVLSLELPEGDLHIVRNRSFPCLKDPIRDISKALDDPIGAEPFERRLDPGNKVAVIVDDLSRDTPIHIVFPLVLKKLKEAGIGNEDVNVVMATGAHKKQSEEDLLRKIGGKRYGKINLHVHYALDKSSLSLIGFTSLGTPVWINRVVADSDFKIGIGGVRPHAESGYGGGGKIILPGVSAWESIGKHHLLYLSPRSRTGILEGNLFRKDIEECADKAGLDFIVNVVLNHKGKLSGVFAGDPIKAHREGVKVVREICENLLDDKADILIMAFGPKDDTIWQIVGSAYTLSAIDQTVKRDGTVLLFASCEEGIYKPFKGVHHLNYEGTFTETQKYVELLTTSPSTEELLSIAIRGEAPYPEVGAKGVILSRISKRCRLVMVSNNLEKKDVSWFGDLIWGPDEALREALEEQGRDAKVVVMPRAIGPSGSPSMKPFSLPKNF